MTVEEFENADERELRGRANQLFEEASKAGELVRTALLTEARFYLDEIDRRDDRFRSRRDLWLEVIIISLIVIEIAFSYVSLRESREQFAVLHNLESSSASTASTLTELQQTTEQMSKAVQEQLALSYEVALNVDINAVDNRLEITNAGRTPVTLWGMRIADDAISMLTHPHILAPGTSSSFPGERIIALGVEQVNKRRAASLPLTLFLKNEKSQEFIARYVFVNAPLNRPFSMWTQTISVTPATWSRNSR